MRNLVLLGCVLLAACSTDRYIKDDGTHVTVKRFAGVPYLEESVTTEIEPVDAGSHPM